MSSSQAPTGPAPTLQQLLESRYSDAPAVDAAHDIPTLRGIAGRGSCRSFVDAPVPDAMVQVLCATALASPTKSDLQQRDIVLVQDQTKRAALAQLVAGQAWVAQAPLIAVFCGNNRRQRLLHEWQDVPFANDHLDAFFNAATDAAIALGAFVTAAEALGLGCCPISAVRNQAQGVSDMLDLPQHVFPFAGLAIGFPSVPCQISPRLPMAVTVHKDRYCEDGVKEAVEKYDRDRTQRQPYAQQRFVETFGHSDTYGWSEDKVRQYSQPERADFAQFVRARGFALD